MTGQPAASNLVDDFVARAAGCTQADFVAAFPFPFLVGAALDKPVTGPTQTLRGDSAAFVTLRKPVDRMTPSSPPSDMRLALAVRKVQDSFPRMITIGRTKNNDVVLADPLVSKFHAYLRQLDDAWLLADAGSVNGTRVGDVELPRRGQPQRIQWGDRIAFGDRVLSFLDAAATWQALRARR